MKSIEERSKAYAETKCSPWLSMVAKETLLDKYIKEYIEIATEQKANDIETIPQLYVRWLMIEGDKPTWKEYANKAMEE